MRLISLRNKMQSEAADFAPGAATGRIVWNIHAAFLAHSLHYMKTWRHPQNRKYITPQITCTGKLVKFRVWFLANVILTFTFAICYRPSVCRLSVTLVHPTQAVELFGNFFHHTIAQRLYFSGAKNRWWRTPLSPWNLGSKWPTPFQTAQFRPMSAHSASTVIASEKSSISTYRKSSTRFPTSHRWTVYVTPKSRKGRTKTRYRCLCQ